MYEPRQTGRTNRMLAQVLLSLEQNKVIHVVAANRHQACVLRENFARMFGGVVKKDSVEFGNGYRKVIFRSVADRSWSWDRRQFEGYDGVPVFIDHYAIESSWGKGLRVTG